MRIICWASFCNFGGRADRLQFRRRIGTQNNCLNLIKYEIQMTNAESWQSFGNNNAPITSQPESRELSVITRDPRGEVQSTNPSPLYQSFGFDVAINPEKKDCWFGFMKCLFKYCCCLCDCTSEMTLYDAISRYEEEFILPPDVLIKKVTKNRFMITILNSLYKSYPDFFFTYLPTGSLREGFGKLVPSTSILATDYDIMLVPDGVTVGELNPDSETPDIKPVFTAIDAPQKHLEGFLWLKLEDKYLTQWENICLRRHVGNEGCSLLSSQKWRGMLEDSIKNCTEIFDLMNTYSDHSEGVAISVKNSGPALTIEVTASHSRCCKKDERMRYFYADFTLGLHCMQWPKRAMEFFNSKYRKNWPPQEAIELIKKLGCHVVPKSSTKELVKLTLGQEECTTYGQCPGLEWRYSFSQPEIILSKYIPQPARTAYLAFKALVKRHFNRRFGKICSYALKCIMYWVVESKPKQFWENNTKDTVECVFRDMLAMLNEGLKEGKCPNYWIPKINLFSGLLECDLISKRALMADVMENPRKYVTNNWLEYMRYVRVNCCYCGHGYAAPAYYVHRVIYDETDNTCQCCRIKCSYKDKAFPCCGGQYMSDPLSLEVY